MEKYNHKEIEAKWQKYWEENGLYKADDFSDKPKWYTLVEFPYPSGAGLHVGHVRSYTALDVISRKLRMQGYNVLYPIGWDAFGLPTENYAIKNKIHPRIATEQNIITFKRQLKSLGLSYDWSREINTTDPKYYKWTQWIFLKLFENGLAYKKKLSVNWCSSCKIVLANEEVVGDKCERCGAQVIKKEKEQWLLAITKYADRLIEDLKTVDYLEKIKIQQINWIGKSEGVQFTMNVKNSNENIEIYTTRIDTIFGMTYVVVAPEHLIIDKLQDKIENYAEVKEYIIAAQGKTDLERTELQKEKTGVELKGVKIIDPFTKEEIPLFVADYVLGFYGTGAVMAVPAHDGRDFEFAKKYNLPITEVIKSEDNKSSIEKEAYINDGILINSGEYDGLTSAEARQKMTQWLEKNNLGQKKINYKLRDWIFSRQHYWGEPIPIIHCEKCGIVPVSERDLPVELPDVESYEPTDNGESPLAKIAEWVNVKCPKCGGDGKRETDTMPNWAGSSWYFLRYIDPDNDNALADLEKLKQWMPVDLYNGGMEHTTLHLLYSRFWNKFLFDIGASPTSEPYARRRSHGMVLAEDGKKMSKSLGNVINPDDVAAKFGVDTLRIYEMFMGPFKDAIPWSTNNMIGVRRFLEKVWKLQSMISEQGAGDNKIQILLNKTIKKVGEDIENFRFNTAISALMILVNEMEKEKSISMTDYRLLLTILSPFAPHIAEELWSSFAKASADKEKYTKSIFLQVWPEYDENLIKDETVELVVQINGKIRGKFSVSADISEEEAKKMALDDANIQKWLENKEPKKIVFVKGRLLSIVV